MRCPKCQAYCGRNDNYCRHCGLALRNLRLPVKRNAAVPAVWQQAAATVAQGLAAVALGALAEMALRALARRAVGSLPSLLARPKSRPPDGRSLPAKGDGHLPEPTYAVSETVVMRRVTLRQGSLAGQAGRALRQSSGQAPWPGRLRR